MRRILFLISLHLCLSPFVASAAEVRACVYLNPPLSSFDKNGLAQGLLPDLLREVAASKDWQLRFARATWNQCLELLDSGQVEILPVIAFSKERAQRFRFSDQTVITNWGQIYQLQGEPFDSVLKLAGRRVAVLENDVHFLGSGGLRSLADRFDISINFVEVPSYLEAFSRLSRGEVDAALVNRLFGEDQHQKFGVQPTAILINPIQIRPAFSLTSDPSLPGQFDEVLAGWKQDQRSIYYSLVNRWLRPPSQELLPNWLILALAGLGIMLGLMILVNIWARRQIRVKTAELELKNQQLGTELRERHQVESELAGKNEFLQRVIDSVSDPMMVIDTDHRVVKMNRAAREDMPAEARALVTPCCYQVSHASQSPCGSEDHPCPLEKVKETGVAVTLIHHHVTRRGRRIIELNASPLFNQDGSLQAVIEVSRDITERLQIEELLNENQKRLLHLAHHDTLTDLPNRLLFEDRMNQALSKARRSSKQVALFFLDLDHFKDVNDTLGHDFGDLLLIDIADRLRSCVRESDTVARLGGDEFLVLLDEVESIERVETMAERICQALIHELNRDGYYMKVSASIGISLYPNDGLNGPDLLRHADLAMYRAKKQGKANYQFFSSPQTPSLFGEYPFPS